jgi:hypothetical protein
VETEKTKRLELRIKRKNTEEVEASKGTNIKYERLSSSNKKLNDAFHNPGYYKLYVADRIKTVKIDILLNDNNKINDDMTDVIEKCFSPLKSCDKKVEASIQNAFDESMNNVFTEFSALTSLKYLKNIRVSLFRRNSS